MSTFKPLLSATIEDTSKLTYSCLISTKLDGIRCVVIDGVACSRNLKPIRNKHVQACIGKPEYNGLDGELIVGDIFATDCYRVTNSGVMAAEGEPDFLFYVFDRFDMPESTFHERLGLIPKLPFVEPVPHWRVDNEDQLLEIEANLLARGAEGVMVRSAGGIYKHGRSTLKDGILGKLKRFSDAEFKVVGFEERRTNGNIATINSLGYTERSSHKENKFGRGDLGALICETADGQIFNCGTGFDDATRAEIWQNRDAYLGKLVKVKSFLIGVKTLPRFPVFVGWRDEIDI